MKEYTFQGADGDKASRRDGGRFGGFRRDGGRYGDGRCDGGRNGGGRRDGGRYGGGRRRRSRRQPTPSDGRGDPQQAEACLQIGTPGQIIILQPLTVNHIYGI